MGKGLKQLVAEAAAAPIEEQIHIPIHISPEARRALTTKVREWTGWRDAGVVLGPTDPRVSPIATCDHNKHEITVDPEAVLLNPNRVLLTVTPFRLRQEAVLTGALLHEAGHARHSQWKPRTKEQALANPMLHSDGEVPTKQVVALATLMEEPRIEGRVAAEADRIGATGLAWTMRAMAAHVMPMTELSADPSQQIMDLITSWALRAGRQVSINYRTTYRLPAWVGSFTSLVHQTIETHLAERVEAGADLGNDTPNYRSLQVLATLNAMIQCDDDSGPTMIDLAREALRLLFPETDEDDDSDAGDGEAMPSGACGMGEQDDEEAGEEDEVAPSEPEEGDEEAEPQSKPDKPGDGGSDPEEGDAEGDAEGEGEGEGEEEEDSEGEGASDSTGEGEESDAESDTESDTESPLAKALAQMEADAKDQTDDEAEDEAEKPPPSDDLGGTTGGAGAGGAIGGNWRNPDIAEREVAKGAERFLRDMIDASESSKQSLTDQPSASVDGGALAAWKAGGQQRDPHFFIRTRRTVEPSPPIKIAILVDVSASMDSLQEPSALLSWALANAALDLRNFAGRGQQIESCLIHWGDEAEVIQRPGQILPGIRAVDCRQGTTVMHEALDLVEECIPGFYDETSTPVNRLLVQFTDWQIWSKPDATRRVGRALAAGVNMLSVVPSNYNPTYSPLGDILRDCRIQRGASTVIKYNVGNPGAVWQQAATALAGPVVAPGVARMTDEAAAYGF